MTPYERACAAVDRANAEDPQGQELAYGERMAAWAKRLAPDASEELLLAVRAQHVRRWTVPRSSQPGGREGYLRWREGLKKMHADALGAIMAESGYGEASVAKARSLILRKNHATDPEGAVLEDAACLVFLQVEFPGFARKTEPAKMIDILRKTWGKMSENGRRAALALELRAAEKDLVRKALEGS